MEALTSLKKETIDIAKKITELATEKNAEEIVVLDVAKLCSYTDALVICHGRSTKQAQTIAAFISQEMKKSGNKALGIEGDREGHWVLVDFIDVVVHIFYQPVRNFYDLEGIWPEAKAITFDSE